jgi:hypothetical protein
MTGNHWWNQPAFDSGKPEHHHFRQAKILINVVDTNEGDMCAQVACILVQSEGG